MMEATRYVWILWDIAAVIVIALFVRTGALRGLIRMIVSFLGYVVSAGAANMLSAPLARLLYDGVVKDALRMVIVGRLEDLVDGGVTPGEVTAAIPDALRRLMSDDALSGVGGTLRSELTAAVEEIVELALREPVLSILRSLVFLLLFSILIIVVRRVSRLFSGVYRIPVIGTLNTLLGGVIGVLQAAIFLFVASLVARLLIDFSGGGWVWLSERVMDDTYVWRAFYNMIRF